MRTTTAWIRTGFAAIFEADFRSLAVFRIAIAAVVLIDLVGKARNLTAFYTDEGALPRHVLLTELRPWSISLNLISGTFLIETLLFIATGLAALAMLFGHRTRVASIATWALVLSIQWRNPFVLHGADELLRVLLFWGMFLPLGAVWSVDNRSRPAAIRISSVGVAALFLQISYVYWFAVLLKTGRAWRIDGTALSYALSSDELISPIGTAMLEYQSVLRVLSFATLSLEAIGPFLLLTPWFKGPLRTLGIASFIALHMGILMAMNIGYFPLLSAFCMVCFLPSWFWDSLLPKVWSRLPIGLREASAGRALRDIPTRTTSRLAAALVVRRALSGHAVDSGYEPEPGWRPSFANNVLAAAFILYVSIMNVTTVSSVSMPAPSITLPMAVALGLDQRWAMYSPTPAEFTYWFTMPAVLADGRSVDLLQAVTYQDPDRVTQVSWDKPRNVSATFRDMYWLRYLTTLTMPNAQERLLQFGGYACRSWNNWYPDGPMQLQTFEIVYFTQPTLPNNTRGEIEFRPIWQHRCR
jgi:hypothetical protein